MRIDFKTFKYKWHRPASNQFPTGSRVYKGFQGSGKTLSMVKYARDILKKYPNCVIFSNIKLYGFEQLYYHQEFDEESETYYYLRDNGNYQFIHDDELLKHALQFRNGTDGVLVLLDEAHLYFNKKTGISLDVLTAISQQRKDRKRIVFSSQIWEELDISLRKQVKEIVSCRCLFGFLQFNTVYNGETLCYQYNPDGTSGYNAKKIYSELFKHSDFLYESYNTYQKIITNQDYNRSPSSDSHINVVNSTKKQKTKTLFSF
ncbi:hypothetical protein IJG29_03825 [Candidatus Saccharibacteria bacterium]|nr:hypothetical protein [Candidatus Saccharibacteria bacterium]